MFNKMHYNILTKLLIAGAILASTFSISCAGTSALKSAPGFSLSDTNGSTISLSGYKGKSIVIVSFFASWCPPCRRELPELQSFYKNNKHLKTEIIAVDVNESAEIAASVKHKYSLEFPVLVDPNGAVARAWGVRGIPALFIIDKNGKIAGHWVGYRSDMETKLKEIIVPLI